jgi:hypothetical protein
MTEEDRLLLNDLKVNLQQMFQNFKKLETENEMLLEKIAGLKDDIKALKQEKFELDQKQEKLKLANLILSGADENREAKNRINKIVREIDKCIALLNR